MRNRKEEETEPESEEEGKKEEPEAQERGVFRSGGGRMEERGAFRSGEGAGMERVEERRVGLLAVHTRGTLTKLFGYADDGAVVDVYGSPPQGVSFVPFRAYRLVDVRRVQLPPLREAFGGAVHESLYLYPSTKVLSEPPLPRSLIPLQSLKGLHGISPLSTGIRVNARCIVLSPFGMQSWGHTLFWVRDFGTSTCCVCDLGRVVPIHEGSVLTLYNLGYDPVRCALIEEQDAHWVEMEEEEDEEQVAIQDLNPRPMLESLGGPIATCLVGDRPLDAYALTRLATLIQVKDLRVATAYVECMVAECRIEAGADRATLHMRDKATGCYASVPIDTDPGDRGSEAKEEEKLRMVCLRMTRRERSRPPEVRAYRLGAPPPLK